MSEYDDRDRRRRKDKDRKRDESPPKELKIGGIDVGPMLGGAQKHVGTLLPLLGKLISTPCLRPVADTAQHRSSCLR